jgi:hypothetical protein
MPIHDWTRVEAGIFHAFHHSWIEEMARALNGGLLPGDYYALAEQHAAGFGPDVLTLQRGDADEGDAAGRGNLRVAPKLKPTAETEMAFYRRKQDAIAVRHVSGDALVAVVEIVSPVDKRLTVAAYECALSVRAYVVHVAVGDSLPDMPLFLEPQVTVDVPLETTYQSAFAAVPRRWRRVLET